MRASDKGKEILLTNKEGCVRALSYLGCCDVELVSGQLHCVESPGPGQFIGEQVPREFLQVLRLVPQYLFDHGVAFVVSRVLADTPGLDAGDGGGQGGAGGRGARRQRPVHDGRWRRWKGDETATILYGGKRRKMIRMLVSD